ncbi:MAG: NADPH-dependent FMN reductase [Cytophagales bacterium]
MDIAHTPILIISSTNRPKSLTRSVSDHYAKLLQAKHTPTSLLDLQDLPADFTRGALYHNKGKNKDFNRLTAQLDAHQKYVFVVPEYNGAFPGVLKAFIDGYASPQIFKGKKAALVGVSRGHQGNIMGLCYLQHILTYLGMTVFPNQPKLSNMQETSEAYLQQHPEHLARLSAQADGFINF